MLFAHDVCPPLPPLCPGHIDTLYFHGDWVSSISYPALCFIAFILLSVITMQSLLVTGATASAGHYQETQQGV